MRKNEPIQESVVRSVNLTEMGDGSHVESADVGRTAFIISAADVVVFDLDGCLFDDSHRRFHVEGRKKDWDAYHSQLTGDSVILRTRDRLFMWLKSHSNDAPMPVFLTARPDKYRNITEAMIKEGLGLHRSHYDLIMRPDDDFRSSPKFKRGVVESWGGQRVVLAAYDDREDILDAYAEIGVPCYKADVNGVESVEWSTKVRGKTDAGKAMAEVFNGESRINVTLGISEEKIKAAIENKQANVSLTGSYKFEPKKVNAADILAAGAETFRERNGVYKDNWVTCGRVMAALFPEGLTITTPEQHADFSVLTQIVAKLTRFSTSGMTHVDSIHDLCVYSAMMESIVRNRDNK